MKKVFNEWLKIANNGSNFYIFLKLLTKMNFYKGNIGLAYVNVYRFLVEDEITEQYKIDNNDKNIIKNNRNNIVHSYNRFNILNYSDLKKELERFCKKYNIFENKGKNEILIWNLGVGVKTQDGITKYKETTYEYKNKKFKTSFSLEVYLKNTKDKFKEIYILGSETSIWNELFESLLKIYKPEEKIEFKLEELNETFSKLDSRIKCVFIPKGENRKECEEILKY